MTRHSVNNNTRMGLVISLFKFKSFDQFNTPQTASNFRHLLSCGTMVGQSWCKPSVSKHSRIHLSSSFPVCVSVDFVHQSSDTIIVYIHNDIRCTLYTLKRQSSSAVIGKQK